MAHPRSEQLKQGFLLAFVAAGLILAALNWGEALLSTGGTNKSFYRATYNPPTVIVSATPMATRMPQATTEAATPAPAQATPAAGSPTASPTYVPNVDDNG